MEKPETNGTHEKVDPEKFLSSRHMFVQEIKTGTPYQFNPPLNDGMIHNLFIHRAIVGEDVDPNEMLLLKLESKSHKAESEVFPIAYLRAKDIPQVSLNLNIVTPTKFTIAKGKGSVFIVGDYSKDPKEEDEDEESMAEEELEDSEEDESNVVEANTDVVDKKEAQIGIKDRKRKHDETEDTGSKKLRVSETEAKANGDEPMDEAKTTA